VRSILNEQDFSSVLAEDHSLIYFFADWSVYSVKGRRIFEELEVSCRPDINGSFWLADVSDVQSPAAFLGDWLKRQEREDLKLLNPIVAGGGSIMWLQRGAIIDLVPTAIDFGLQDLRKRTETAFKTTQHNTRLVPTHQ
jgi:hypothetical protein